MYGVFRGQLILWSADITTIRLSEAAIFFYLGMEVVLAELHQWEFGLIAVVTAITFLGRGVTVLGLTAGYNCAAPPHKRTSLRSQAVMTAAGLRGGTAYALAMRWDGDAGRIGPVETLTMGGFASAGGGRVVGREFLFALWQTPPDPRSAP